jgi:hypothetical protein
VIEDEFDVVSADRLDPDQVDHHRDAGSGGACPACEVFTSQAKDDPLRRIKTFGRWASRPIVTAEASPAVR